MTDLFRRVVDKERSTQFPLLFWWPRTRRCLSAQPRWYKEKIRRAGGEDDAAAHLKRMVDSCHDAIRNRCALLHGRKRSPTEGSTRRGASCCTSWLTAADHDAHQKRMQPLQISEEARGAMLLSLAIPDNSKPRATPTVAPNRCTTAGVDIIGSHFASTTDRVWSWF